MPAHTAQAVTTRAVTHRTAVVLSELPVTVLATLNAQAVPVMTSSNHTMPGHGAQFRRLPGLCDRPRTRTETWWQRYAGQYAVADQTGGEGEGQGRVAGSVEIEWPAVRTDKTDRRVLSVMSA